MAAISNAGNGSDIGAFEQATNEGSLVVTTTEDTVAEDGFVSLREAVLTANEANTGSSTITFDAGVFGKAKKTIVLSSMLPLTTGDLTVSGPTTPGSGVTITGEGLILFDAGSGSLSLFNLSLARADISVLTEGGRLLLQNCSISGGTSRGYSIFVNPTYSATLRNCTISGNNVGVYMSEAANVMMENCTIAGNTTSGISTYSSSTPSRLDLKNCIVAGNGIDINAAKFVQINSGGYNLIGKNGNLGVISPGQTSPVFPEGNPNANGDRVGTSENPLDAGLDPQGLKDNGGPTPTIALVAGSPAINAGNPNFDAIQLPTDQRGPGYPRILDGRLDIGAFERRNVAPVARNDRYFTKEDTALTVGASQGVLLNDSDANSGDTLTARLVIRPEHGRLTLNPDGSFVYVPFGNYNGPDSFTYSATDGSLSATAKVNLFVTAVNDAPRVVDLSPRVATDLVGQSRRFTLAVFDADGVADVQSVAFRVNTTLTGLGGVTVVYNAARNEVTLLSGNPLSRPRVSGPITPGSGTLSTSTVILKGNTVRITRMSSGTLLFSFVLVPRIAMKGDNVIWGRVEDKGRAIDSAQEAGGYVRKGAWRVVGGSGTAAPPASTLFINGVGAGAGTTKSVVTGTEQIFTFELREPNGAGDLKEARLSIGLPGQVESANGFNLRYEAATNRLFLMPSGSTSYGAGIELDGATGVLQNRVGSIRLEGSRMDQNASSLRLTLAVTFKAGFTGLKQIYSRVQDDRGLVEANSDAASGFKTQGQLQIGAPTITGTSANPSGSSS